MPLEAAWRTVGHDGSISGNCQRVLFHDLQSVRLGLGLAGVGGGEEEEEEGEDVIPRSWSMIAIS